jgi:hypothetical protein
VVALKLIERVAQCKVGHRVACFEAREPQPERLLRSCALGVDRRGEEPAVDRALAAQQRSSGNDDFGSARAWQPEQGDFELDRGPDLGQLPVVAVEFAEPVDAEADDRSGGTVMQQAEVLADALPISGRLVVVGASEFERHELIAVAMWLR